jgi:hypothetical protein
MKYYTQARLFPTLLTSIPLVILARMCVSLFEEDIKHVNVLLPGVSLAVIYTALIFLMVQINRVVGIWFLEISDLYRPSTSQLLWRDDTIEPSIKKILHDKIRTMFQITLKNRDDELKNEVAARKLITQAVSQIRNCLRGTGMVLQHNIEYGFWRNLIGGSIVAVIICTFLNVYGRIEDIIWLKNISGGLFVMYLIPALMSKLILSWYSKRYTKVLFEHFLGHK